MNIFIIEKIINPKAHTKLIGNLEIDFYNQPKKKSSKTSIIFPATMRLSNFHESPVYGEPEPKKKTV